MPLICRIEANECPVGLWGKKVHVALAETVTPQWQFEERLSKLSWHPFSGEIPPKSEQGIKVTMFRMVPSFEDRVGPKADPGFRSMGSCHVAKANIMSSAHTEVESIALLT